MTFGAPDRTTRPPEPGHRSRTRTVVLVAVAGWAVLEIWLLTVVAGAIGGGSVLLLLLAGLVFGGIAVRRAGRRAWNSLTAAMRPGSPGDPDAAGPQGLPRAEGAGTAVLGGLLLMVPGFVSDAAGLLCLFPPTRRLLGVAGGGLGRRLGRRSHPAGSFGEAFRQARMHRPDGRVVPGEVVREDAGEDSRPGPGTGGDHRGGPPRPPLAP